MTLPGFVAHYEDLSSDRGYQFKFYCDSCTRSFTGRPRTTLKGEILRVASRVVPGMSDAVHQVKEAVGDERKAAALEAAVQEAQAYFRRCPACGKWVCQESCWNRKRSRCESCAPNEEEEASVRRLREIEASRKEEQESRDRMYERGNMERYLKGKEAFQATCPACGARVKPGRFCSSCGAVLADKGTCSGCGAENEPGAKFCSECGRPCDG